MFENRKYISRNALKKLEASGIIHDILIMTPEYTESYLFDTVMRHFKPVRIIRFCTKDQDVVELRCVGLKNTYRIYECVVNGVVMKRH